MREALHRVGVSGLIAGIDVNMHKQENHHASVMESFLVLHGQKGTTLAVTGQLMRVKPRRFARHPALVADRTEPQALQ